MRLYHANRGMYGSPRIHAALRGEGEPCGKKRVAQLMRELGLSAKPLKHRTRTTDCQHEHTIAPNVLNREFTASAPNTKWVADITAIWTAEGWLYLAVVLDIYSRIVVGWAMDGHRDEALVGQAARMALVRRQPEPRLTFPPSQLATFSCLQSRCYLCSYRPPLLRLLWADGIRSAQRTIWVLSLHLQTLHGKMKGKVSMHLVTIGRERSKYM